MRILATVEDRATPVFDRLSANYPAARQGLIRTLAEALQEHVKASAPVGEHYALDGTPIAGGTLRASLAFEVGPDGATLLGAAHGLYVIGGTRPHAIHASRAPALRFWWQREGVQFYGPSVRHPGHPANDFRLTALARAFGDGTVERAAERFWQAVAEGG